MQSSGGTDLTESTPDELLDIVLELDQLGRDLSHSLKTQTSRIRSTELQLARTNEGHRLVVAEWARRRAQVDKLEEEAA